ncbi:MAG TPA: universal stress protein [bacterium]|nr:universal stress protein [bacterium]
MLPNGPIKKILVYIDGSEECIAAAQYAIVLAKSFGARLTALYIVNISLLEELVKARIFIKIEEMDYQQDLEQDGKRYLHYISEMARSKGVEIRTELVKGIVNKEVVKKIDELEIDLLVMGELEQIHSRSETFHDEAEITFRKAGCSVLVVKDPERVERIFELME